MPSSRSPSFPFPTNFSPRLAVTRALQVDAGALTDDYGLQWREVYHLAVMKHFRKVDNTFHSGCTLDYFAREWYVQAHERGVNTDAVLSFVVLTS